MTDASAVDAMLARMDADASALLPGVIHSVGVLSDGALDEPELGAVRNGSCGRRCWARGTFTERQKTATSTSSSSSRAVVGDPRQSAGQANHAAANAYLDQLAAHRRARGLPGPGHRLGSVVGNRRSSGTARAD